MKVAKLSGMSSVECIHLQQCNEAYTIAPKQTRSLGSLKNLSGDGQLTLLSDSTISRCGALQEFAKKEQSNLLVAVHDSERFIHFSVLDDGVHYYAKLGRVSVTADMLHGYLDCSCCARRRGCVHKAICKWYLHENKLLNKLLGDNEQSEEQDQAQENELDKESEIKINPSENPHIIKKMCEYLLEKKKIPLNFEPKKLKKLPMFVPIETECHFCDISLGAPICVTQKASLLTMNNLRKNLEIYNKSCSECGASYRHQKYCNGIHNFNGEFLISTEVCTFLRNCLLQHIPIGSIAKVMEAKIGTSLNSHTILNAYLHFDALNEHSYDYS